MPLVGRQTGAQGLSADFISQFWPELDAEYTEKAQMLYDFSRAAHEALEGANGVNANAGYRGLFVALAYGVDSGRAPTYKIRYRAVKNPIVADEGSFTA